MIYPLVRELAAEKIPVAVTCRVLGFSKQAYYKWQANPVSQRDWDDAHLINAALDIHRDDPAFGYRFIADELRERGIATGENRVARLCSGAADLVGLRQQARPDPQVRAAGTRRPGRPAVHRAGPEYRLADRHHRTLDRRGHALPLRGHRRLLQADRRLLDRLAHEGIPGRGGAAQRPGPARSGGHRGALRARQQFRSHAYVRALREAQLRGSMGRVGACADNAAMESFFALLQKNVLNRRRWQTREQLRLAIVVWIERTYHRRRRQDTLGRLTPIEFETLLQTAHAA
jgi:transposase InsO family protein